MFSPRLRPLKGHERSYGSCKMKHSYFVQRSTDTCKYYKIAYIHLIKHYQVFM